MNFGMIRNIALFRFGLILVTLRILSPHKMPSLYGEGLVMIPKNHGGGADLMRYTPPYKKPYVYTHIYIGLLVFRINTDPTIYLDSHSITA